MDIGIDLGTTFSAIAVKGKIELAPGFSGSEYLEQMDVTILPTETGNLTIPSVFWWHPDEPDRYLFGDEAKQMAEEGKSPIMFSKRSIGMKETLMLNGREFTAKEVATLFLRYMKDLAERVTGQKVGRAVVTHPAYFDPSQRQETLQAAIDAGLDINEAQLMLEPCAAALAYTASDTRGRAPGEALRVMTYDLGGGTFDVAVMEKIEGVIQMRRFGGDHLLGGYNFDRAFIEWIIDQLKAKGKTIPYDENNEEHKGRRARMLQVAEAAKIRLSEQKVDRIQVPVSVDFLVDDQGQRVQFRGQINREQYAALIRDELRKTLDCCWTALENAGGGIEVTVDQQTGKKQVKGLDAILLVGGSTKGQWITDAVRKEFGDVGEPYFPDLCVAAGAAIFVSQLPPPATRNSRIELKLDYPRESSLRMGTISGRVAPCKGSDLTPETCRRLQVHLDAPDGSVKGPAEVSEVGGFSFPQVALNEDGSPSTFTVRVEEDGQEVLRQDGAVVYKDVEDPTGGQITSSTIRPSLPRPLFLKADRMVSIAEEGALLPAKCQVRLRRAFGGPTMSIPIYMQDEKQGDVFIEGIPDEAGEGCAVVVDVEVTVNNEMRGKVLVYAPNGKTVAKDGEVRFSFPPPLIPEISELLGRFDELKDRLEMAIVTAPPQDRARLAGPGKTLVRRIAKKIEGQAPDRQELFEAIKELDRVVNPPPDDMDPPRRDFENLVSECRENLAANAENPSLKAFASQLDRVEAAGKEACAQKNNRRWQTANDTLRKIAAAIEDAISGPRPKSETKTPPPSVLKAQAARQIEGLRAELKTARDACIREGRGDTWIARCEEYARKIDHMASEVAKIADDSPPEQAMAQVQSYLGPALGLGKKIAEIRKKIDVISD